MNNYYTTFPVTVRRKLKSKISTTIIYVLPGSLEIQLDQNRDQAIKVA